MDNQTRSSGAQPSILERFLGSDYWFKARAAMGGRDNRVLVIGPGEDSGLAASTVYARTLLQENGFEPQSLDEVAPISYQLEQAMLHPFVVSIVRTVGTASETLMLLNKLKDPTTRSALPSVLVIVPRQYRRAHFARVTTEEFGVNIVECDQLDCANDSFGRVVLDGLARLVLARERFEASRAANAEITFRADDQGRRAVLEGGGMPDRNKESGYVAVVFFVGVLIALAGLVVLVKYTTGSAYAAFGVLAVVLVLLIVFIVIFFLSNQKFSEKSAVNLLSKVLDKVPTIGRQPATKPDKKVDDDDTAADPAE